MTTTVSRILFNSRDEAQAKLLEKWCDEAAKGGGSFSIEDEWQAPQWYRVYTINWPNGSREKA
ncbi:hypothetical protein [Cupriavidus gilardii]|uniref:hypothetical protein n=1 Tax=Cupriavidus gilardii TaxID=82541 RepID=UPI0021BE7BAE|nr:hypothetical protein [Cupriavidus gilardii]MCT9017123.1 hypothetical protein [Cupriavidus gilardii]MCT9056793.1 hypothetical protein [Cupriavidus gilardii]MCT9125363.1 hypothetical protein [Cupriavidus gilardii]